MKPAGYAHVIDESEIQSLMQPDGWSFLDVGEILDRAGRGEGLGLEEAARLMAVEDEPSWKKIYASARDVKERVFGKRIVLFAPLYVSNRCSNNCLYCGFRRDNRSADRRTLSVPEIVREARHLSRQGYRRILLVAGEDSVMSSVDYLSESIDAIYRGSGIRIVHVNAAPMTGAEFSTLKSSGAGVYQCFQETYHRGTYERMHPSGPKHDYEWRLTVMDRAMAGGFDDVGMGALFGLYDYRFEVLALISHVRYLEKRFGVGPHTLSIPRLRPAEGSALSQVPFPVSDEVFKRIVAILRLAAPYAGIVVSTREGACLRDEVIHLGASQISAGSRTDIGGYAGSGGKSGTEQFSLDDARPLDEMIEAVLAGGLIPSLCTSCYRSGRTGERFRAVAEKGGMQQFCLANALFSLSEYLREHGEEEARSRGLGRVREMAAKVQDPIVRRRLEEGLDRITEGADDVHL
jgi:2-iminoacetate synthase